MPARIERKKQKYKMDTPARLLAQYANKYRLNGYFANNDVRPQTSIHNIQRRTNSDCAIFCRTCETTKSIVVDSNECFCYFFYPPMYISYYSNQQKCFVLLLLFLLLFLPFYGYYSFFLYSTV